MEMHHFSLDIRLKDLIINENMTTLKALARGEKSAVKVHGSVQDLGLRWVVLSSNERFLSHVQRGRRMESTRFNYVGLSKETADEHLTAMRNR